MPPQVSLGFYNSKYCPFLNCLTRNELMVKIEVYFNNVEKEKVMLLKSAKLFIYPSKLDAFPIVVLEALACGLPVIAYDIPAIRCNYPSNIIARVPRGNIEEFARVVTEFLLDENKLSTISSLTVSFATKFTWDNVAWAEVQTMKQLLSTISS